MAEEEMTAADALALIPDLPRVAIDNLDKIEGLNHDEVVQQLIAAELGGWLAYHLSEFKGLDHSEIARQLFHAGEGQSVAEHLDRFIGLNHSEIAQQLIAVRDYQLLADYLDKFAGLNSQTALTLIAAGEGRSVVDNLLYSFQGLNHTEIAEAIIQAGLGEYVAQHLDKFFEAILCDEYDALESALLMADMPRDDITFEKFTALVRLARNGTAHEGEPRAFG